MPDPIDTSKLTPAQLERARLANVGAGSVPGAGVPITTDDTTGQVQQAPVQDVADRVVTPTAPAQKYLSDPGAAAAQDPFKVVGTMPGGTQTSVSRSDLGQAGKDALQAQEEALNATAKAQEQSSQIAQQRAQIVAEGEKARAAEADRVANEQALRSQQLSEKMLNRANSIQAKVDQFQASTQDIDANRYWAKQSTGQAIGNVISIALSGLGQMFSARGGNVNARNGAMDVINQFIDRDIETQKMQMQAKERGIAMEMNAYNVARDAGATDQEAKALAADKRMQAVEAQVRAKVAQLGPGQEKANGETLLAQITQQRANLKMQFAEMNKTQIQSSASEQPVLAGQMQAATAAQQRKEAGLVEYDPKLQTKFGQAASAEQKRDLDNAAYEMQRADNAVKVFEKMQDKKYLTPSEERAFNAARGQYLAFMHGKYGAQIGRFSPEVVKLMEPSVPARDAISYFSGADKSATKDARQGLEEMRQHFESTTVKTVK